MLLGHRQLRELRAQFDYGNRDAELRWGFSQADDEEEGAVEWSEEESSSDEEAEGREPFSRNEDGEDIVDEGPTPDGAEYDSTRVCDGKPGAVGRVRSGGCL